MKKLAACFYFLIIISFSSKAQFDVGGASGYIIGLNHPNVQTQFNLQVEKIRFGVSTNIFITGHQCLTQVITGWTFGKIDFSATPYIGYGMSATYLNSNHFTYGIDIEKMLSYNDILAKDKAVFIDIGRIADNGSYTIISFGFRKYFNSSQINYQ